MSDTQEPQFDRLLAPMLFSLTVSAILFGVTIMQVLQYQRNSQRDPYVLKILVYFLLSETLPKKDVGHHPYGFPNPGMLLLYGSTFCKSTHTHPPNMFAIYVTAVNNLLCQMFMCWRIWVLWKDQRIFAVPLIFFIILLAISAVAVGFVYAIMGWHSHTVEGFETKKTLPLMYTAYSALILADILITSTLCLLLYHRSAQFKRSIIKIVTVYFISSCLLTTIMQFMVLISVIAWPNTEIWVGLFAVLSKFYFNSLLVTLNSRSPVDNQPVASTEIPLQFISGGQSNPAVISFQSQTSQVRCNGPGIVVGIDDVIEVVDDTGEKLGSV
ncbi:hypothetical protein C8R41DRAFT_902945 [Lentinula lateritia]|uniref:DUF6534 domain-containing protein n=1 Tax=Lentinula lateritia TaxID=40482 RepID=A0ABQ8VFM6_9AGAR|nr:hypothetical protein C8R41DRAFT_902945 [Lentinula lateritia]